MLHWLRCMAHPDGEIGFFNDAAPGIAPQNAQLESYARRLGVVAEAPARDSILLLSPSGYVRASHGAMLALIDVAPVGPDYLPGPAHADTLSFELSLAGRRVVVNGGTSCYGASAERLRQRGTAAHSTVQLGGVDSSEVWSGFRVGRRARPFDVKVSAAEVQASHDGYAWLPGMPVHRRVWRFESDAMEVQDELLAGSHPAVARFHLAPGVTATQAGSEGWNLHRGERSVARVQCLVGRCEVTQSTHSPAFGVVVPTQTLTVHLVAGRASTRWSWSSGAHPLSE